jgi:hypothetical protein
MSLQGQSGDVAELIKLLDLFSLKEKEMNKFKSAIEPHNSIIKKCGISVDEVILKKQYI